jgi:hypothetical protein
MALNWLTGLWAVVCLRLLLGRLCHREWVANITVLAFLCTNAFLNYTQTGASYVPGLALLLSSLYFLLPGESADRDVGHSRWTAIGAGATLAGAVCFWFPFVLVVPGTLALPLLFRRRPFRNSLQLVLTALVAFAVCVGIPYVTVALILGIHTPQQFLEWMAGASHGYKHGGVARFIFGFARSFVNMGQDGLLFKRYLLHDPYSPVSLLQLFRVSLLKLGLFYLLLLSTVFGALRTDTGRRLIAAVSLQAVPIFVFALFLFEAGMPERYLPLYPAIFLTFGYSLSADRTPDWLRYLILICMTALMLSNVNAMRVDRLARQDEPVLARIREMQPRLKPNSLVCVVHLQDELSGLYFNFPFHPINRQGTLNIYSVTEPGSERNLTWRRDFAMKALTNWQAGGDVWLSKRLFAERPLPEWNWAEGDDKRISWADLLPFFSRLEVEEELGGEDGFALLAHSGHNEEFLRALIR